MSCSPKEITYGTTETIKVPIKGKLNGVYIDLLNQTTNLEIILEVPNVAVSLASLVFPGVWESYGQNYWATAEIDTAALVPPGDYQVHVRFVYGTQTPLLTAENLLSVVV